jgi:aminoglycoside phosphotransferase (APT) family kinase protein
LRVLAAPADQEPWWVRLLPRYAEAQLTLAGHHDDLVAAGVPSRSPATLPGQAAELVRELAEVDEARGGLGPDRRAALEARLPAYQRWCAALAASGIPDTLQHDDLHAANICVQVSRVRVIDWGDASLGHPFGTMLATLNSIAHHAGVGPEDPLVRRARDAYLEPFTPYADRRDLVELVEQARRAGRVTRALTWRAALVTAPLEAHAEWDFPVRGWLEEILGD